MEAATSPEGKQPGQGQEACLLTLSREYNDTFAQITALLPRLFCDSTPESEKNVTKLLVDINTLYEYCSEHLRASCPQKPDDTGTFDMSCSSDLLAEALSTPNQATLLSGAPVQRLSEERVSRLVHQIIDGIASKTTGRHCTLIDTVAARFVVFYGRDAYIGHLTSFLYSVGYWARKTTSSLYASFSYALCGYINISFTRCLTDLESEIRQWAADNGFERLPHKIARSLLKLHFCDDDKVSAILSTLPETATFDQFVNTVQIYLLNLYRDYLKPYRAVFVRYCEQSLAQKDRQDARLGYLSLQNISLLLVKEYNAFATREDLARQIGLELPAEIDIDRIRSDQTLTPVATEKAVTAARTDTRLSTTLASFEDYVQVLFALGVCSYAPLFS